MKLTPQDHTTAVAAVASYRAHILDLTLKHREIIPTSTEALDELLAYLDAMRPRRGSVAILGALKDEELVPALLWFGRHAADAALALLTEPPAPVSTTAALDAYHASIAALAAPYNTMQPSR